MIWKEDRKNKHINSGGKNMNKVKKIISIILTVLTFCGIFSCATSVAAAEYSENQRREAYFNENLSGYLQNIVNTEDAVKIFEVEKIAGTDNENSGISTASLEPQTNSADNTSADVNHEQLTLELEDGSNTAYTFSEPISFIDENGELKFKDTNIKALSNQQLNKQGYTFENGTNDYKAYFGKKSSTGVMIINPKNVKVRLVPISTLSSNGQVVKLEDDGKEIDAFLYNGVYDSSTALRFTPQLNGLKEEIVINQYTGKTSYDFNLYTYDYVAAINSYGDIEIIDKETKEIVETFKAPFAYDSTLGFDETSVHYTDCEYELDKIKDGQYKLTITIPEEYLTLKTTEYPVVIDPVTSHISMYYDTSIYSEYTTSSFSSNPTACVGKTNSDQYGRGRPLYFFKMPTEIESYATITSAKMYLRETTGRTDSDVVRPFIVKDKWNNSVTWETRPMFARTISYPGKTDLVLPGKNINSASTDVSSSPYWYAFNITYAVRAWITKSMPNRGIKFVADSEIDNTGYQWRAFATKEYSTSSYRPYTVINYTNDTVKPVINSVSGNPTEYTNKNVTLTVSASDSPYGIYQYSFDNGTTWQTSKSKAFSSNQTVKIKVKDYAGNISAATSVAITKIDKTKPTVAFTPSEATDNYTPVSVTITIGDACKLKSYSIDGATAVSVSGTSKTISKSWVPGESHTVVVNDVAGNTLTKNYSVALPFPNDSAEPYNPDIFEEDGLVYINSRSFDYDEETDSTETVQYKLGNGNWTEYTEPLEIVRTADVTIYGRVIDEAGHTSEEVSLTLIPNLGEYKNSYNDIALGENLFPIGFDRTYSSKSGWFFSFDSCLTSVANGYILKDFYGEEIHYISENNSDDNAEFFSLTGEKLVTGDGTLAGKAYAYKLEYSGLTLYFDSSKKLAIVCDEYNTVVFNWTASSLAITNKHFSTEDNLYINKGEAVVTFLTNKPIGISVTVYDDNNQNSSTKCIQYTWSDNNLTSFTDTLGNVHNYTYTNGLLSNDDGVVIDYANGRVKRITQKNGAFVKYTYNDTAENTEIPANIGAITVSDSKGVTETYSYANGNEYDYTSNALYNPSAIDNSITTDTISSIAYVVEYPIEEEETPEGEETEEPSAEETETSDLYDKHDDGSYTFYQYDENNRVIATLEIPVNATLTVTDSTTFADAEAVAESKTLTTYASDVDDTVIDEVILERNPGGYLVNKQKSTYSYTANGLLQKHDSFTWSDNSFWLSEYSQEYIYNGYGNLTQEISTVYTLVPNSEPDGIDTVATTTYTYDAWNQLTGTTITENNVVKSSSTTTYDYLGRAVSETYDDDTVSYVYNADGNITSYTENDQTTSYQYNDGGDVVSRTNPEDVVASYTYDSFGNLTNHSFNGYAFTYNTLGSILTASTGSQSLAAYTYSADTMQNVLSANFGNGQNISYVYNEDGEITDIKLSDNTKYAYQYFSETVGNEITEWSELTDYVNNLTKVLEESKTTVKDSNDSFIYSVESVVDANDEITGEKVTIGSTEYTVGFGENIDTFKIDGTQKFTKSYTENDNGELIGEQLSTGYSKEYGYNSNSAIATLENILNNLTLEYSYGYNSRGNITAETLTRRTFGSQGETLDTSETTVYTYDSKQQLVSAENNSTKWEYTYDNRGNILTAKEYVVTVNTDGEKVYTLKENGEDTFTYTDTWEDKLTSFNGQSITYDAIGNPVSYKGNTLTWTMGRQLASYGTNTYKYNEDGIRTSKTVNGVTTSYLLNGTNIIQQSNGTDILYFYYDSNGEVIGFNYSNNDYFYVKNSMDDIVAIADNTGSVVVEYTYNPWGAVTSVTGSNTTIGNLNPFRYRSYYYDSDIEMYYLQSRYYDPEICRFINSDDVNYIGVTELEVSYNPFAYCENDPVNATDTLGSWAQYYNGFKWTSVGFNVIVKPIFLSKYFCMIYSKDIIKIKGKKYWWGKGYKKMSILRIAQELWFHAVAYYAGSIIKLFLRKIGYPSVFINDMVDRAYKMEINNNDDRVAIFKVVWWAAYTIKSMIRYNLGYTWFYSYVHL